MRPVTLFMSCEHAFNHVPEAYTSLFRGHEIVLSTHRGYDIGAFEIGSYLSKTLSAPLITSTVTRLLIDCNRRLSHKHCFSEFTGALSNEEKQTLISKFYSPYRQKVEKEIQNHIDKGYQVFHLSVHSFTPVFKGVVRKAGIGLLYDTRRHGEREVAREWLKILFQQDPVYRVRMNYPYNGRADGFTSALRRKHSQNEYIGVELEVNQALVTSKTSLQELLTVLANSLTQLLLLL